MYRIYYCKIGAHRVTLDDSGYSLEDPECYGCQDIAGIRGGDGAHVTNQNVQLSDFEKRSLTLPFGPKAMKFQNARDVDKRIEAFKRKNPILQEGYKPKSMRQIYNEKRGS